MRGSSPTRPFLSAFSPVTLPLLVLTQTSGEFFPKCAGPSPLPSVYTSSDAAPSLERHWILFSW